jgi:hypothetical protein
MWQFLDHDLWQTVATLSALVAAYYIGKEQNKINKAIYRIQDTVELYCFWLIVVNKDENEHIISSLPYIHIQNIGTRLIYLDKYIFNGRVYAIDGQVLPSTYSQAINNFYRIELPTNGESHVSLEVFYRDLENRQWSSVVYADKKNNIWEVKTLPRK